MSHQVIIGRVGYQPPHTFGFRCDRNSGSPLGNPFKSGKTITRKRACELFKEHFSKEISKHNSDISYTTRRLLRELKTKDVMLQCHCVPLQCHCEIIKEYLDEKKD